MASSTDYKTETTLKLYPFWKNSCASHVQIALTLKGVKYEYIRVDLFKGGQNSPEFRELNPIGHVPVLVDSDVVASDSFAILTYLEDKLPQHPLLPPDLQKRAVNYQAASIVASDIQPYQNKNVLKYIDEKVSPDEKLVWIKHHIGKGFEALEKLLRDHSGKFATGDEIFLADLLIAPEIYAATKWFNIEMTNFPLLFKLNEVYSEMSIFQDAMPEKQPDASSECNR